MMLDTHLPDAGIVVVPASVRQLGDYELDLLKLTYFGWINALSLGMCFWQERFMSEDGNT